MKSLSVWDCWCSPCLGHSLNSPSESWGDRTQTHWASCKMIFSKVPELRGALPANVQVQIHRRHLFSSHLRAWSVPRQPRHAPCQPADVGLTQEADRLIEKHLLKREFLWPLCGLKPFVMISVSAAKLCLKALTDGAVVYTHTHTHTHTLRTFSVIGVSSLSNDTTNKPSWPRHSYSSYSSFLLQNRPVAFWHADSEWIFGSSLAFIESHRALWYCWCV